MEVNIRYNNLLNIKDAMGVQINMRHKLGKFLLVIILAISCALVGCGGNGGGGSGGSGGSGGNGGGGGETKLQDYEFVKLDSGAYCISKYIGSDADITLPSRHADGTEITGIYYELFADFNKSHAPFEGTVVQSVHIPSSITTLTNGGEYINDKLAGSVFYGAEDLKTITVDGANSTLMAEDGALYNKDKSVLLACPYNKTKLDLPQTVVKINEHAFDYGYMQGDGVETSFNSTNVGKVCSKIESVKVSSTLKEFSFSGCRQLRSVDLSQTSVEILPLNAFAVCVSLSSVILPNSLKYIGTQAFLNSAITSIEIPSNVRGLDYPLAKDSASTNIFMGCKSLESITAPAQLLFGEYGSEDISVDENSNGVNNFLNCLKLKIIIVNGASPGTRGKAHAVADFTADTGFCSASIAKQCTFTSLESITYQNGCFTSLDERFLSAFERRYDGVTLNK